MAEAIDDLTAEAVNHLQGGRLGVYDKRLIRGHIQMLEEKLALALARIESLAQRPWIETVTVDGKTYQLPSDARHLDFNSTPPLRPETRALNGLPEDRFPTSIDANGQLRWRMGEAHDH